VADCIASVARRSIDVVARYGGEEFAVVLPDMGSNAAANSAEKVRRGVEALRIRQLPIVTVSVGCATGRPADGRNAPELLAAADAQLYAAKAAGRNQVQGVDWTQAQPDSLSDHADQAKRHA
jgi:diguanylate cyclase (GGDEF)-like protein